MKFVTEAQEEVQAGQEFRGRAGVRGGTEAARPEEL